jgi:hypothetical protein
MFYQTQAQYDAIVQSMITYEVDIAIRCVKLREQNDPTVFDWEERLMMLQNCLFSLRDYDITWGWLTQAEIDYMFEIITTLLQTCPL